MVVVGILVIYCNFFSRVNFQTLNIYIDLPIYLHLAHHSFQPF